MFDDYCSCGSGTSSRDCIECEYCRIEDAFVNVDEHGDNECPCLEDE